MHILEVRVGPESIVVWCIDVRVVALRAWLDDADVSHGQPHREVGVQVELVGRILDVDHVVVCVVVEGVSEEAAEFVGEVEESVRKLEERCASYVSCFNLYYYIKY